MFKSCHLLLCGILGITLSVVRVNAMLGCDYKTLNRKVDAYVMTVEAKEIVSKETFQNDLQFLSCEASKDESFSEFLNESKFDDLCVRGATLQKIDWLMDLCRDVFKNSSDKLKRAQAFILMQRVILMLEILTSAGMPFVPTVFD